jgi:hypothetical protein
MTNSEDIRAEARRHANDVRELLAHLDELAASSLASHLDMLGGYADVARAALNALEELGGR